MAISIWSSALLNLAMSQPSPEICSHRVYAGDKTENVIDAAITFEICQPRHYIYQVDSVFQCLITIIKMGLANKIQGKLSGKKDVPDFDKQDAEEVRDMYNEYKGKGSTEKEPSSKKSSGKESSNKDSNNEDGSGQLDVNDEQATSKSSANDTSGPSGEKDKPDWKQIGTDAKGGATGVYKAAQSDDPSTQFKHGKEAVAGGGAAAVGAAAAYAGYKGSNEDKPETNESQGVDGTNNESGFAEGSSNYKSSAQQSSYDQSNVPNMASGGKDDTSSGSNLDFSTGNKQLDEKLSHLDPDLQKQAKDAFNRGYQDAQKSLKV